MTIFKRKRRISLYTLACLSITFIIFTICYFDDTYYYYYYTYELSRDNNRHNNVLLAPDPFPKGKPDFRKIKAEQQQQQLKQQEEKSSSSSLSLNEENNNNNNNQNQEKQKSPNEKSIQDYLNDSNNPLYDKFSQSNVLNFDKLSPRQRISNRRNRYLEYMRVFQSLSAEEQKTESSKLQSRFLAMEHLELKKLEKPVDNNNNIKSLSINPSKDKIVVLTVTKNNNNSKENLKNIIENRQEYCQYHGYIHYFLNLTSSSTSTTTTISSSSFKNSNLNNKKINDIDMIKSIRQTFKDNPSAEWVWWLDTDALIMNPYFDLTKEVLNDNALEQRLTYGRPLRNSATNFVNGAYMERGEINFKNLDIIISQDFFGLNRGSFFIKRSSFSDYFLDTWEDMISDDDDDDNDDKDNNENNKNKFNQLFLNHEKFQQHFGLVPQRLFNSYMEEDEGWVWAYKEGDFLVRFSGCFNNNNNNDNDNEKKKCENKFLKMWNFRTRINKDEKV